MKASKFAWTAPLIALLCGFFALGLGRYSVPVGETLRALGSGLGLPVQASQNAVQVLMSMRLPRVLLAMAVGAGLSAAGCAFQSLFANPLATPDTLGVASGASFGAALALLLGFGFAGVQATAFAAGLAAVALTYLAGRPSAGSGDARNTVVLAGIMIGSLFSALVSLVKFTADTESELPAITYWLMGSLAGKGWRTLAMGVPVILAGLLVLLVLRWRMNLLPLPEDEARAAGTNIRSLRAAVILASTAMTAACVSMCGQVGWVGLLVPHMCRMLLGSDHRRLLPATIWIGAAFMVAVDTLARTATAAEIPISILTAILGAPFFILLMRRKGGWRL